MPISPICRWRCSGWSGPAAEEERLAICGDYDADGMTSTALLVGVLQRLGARPMAAIPSRQDDGYGLNAAMVERLAGEGIALLVTVDNGIAAAEALERARQLAVEVILTDHHTIPEQRPPYLALLHPACTPPESPFRGLAGVGLAYVLAMALSRRLGSRQGLDAARDLFCIGTIADMAPLLGVNRRWLLDGLPQLRRSRLAGLQALQRVAGLEDDAVDAQVVGFQLAPRINAVGRLGDPELVVELLTTDDPERALELARDCEALNRQRRELCGAIEAEAIALVDADGPHRSRFPAAGPEPLAPRGDRHRRLAPGGALWPAGGPAGGGGERPTEGLGAGPAWFRGGQGPAGVHRSAGAPWRPSRCRWLHGAGRTGGGPA